MTYQFIHITANGVEYCNCGYEIPLEELKKRVGEPNKSSWIEVVYNQFTDPSVVIICDEEGRIKRYPVRALTAKNTILCGDIVIAALVPTKENERTIGGLTRKQINSIKPYLSQVTLIFHNGYH